MSDGAGSDVRVKEACIQHEDLDEGGEAELSRLQYEAALVQIMQQFRLRPIQTEGSLLPLLRLDRIEVVQPPEAVG